MVTAYTGFSPSKVSGDECDVEQRDEPVSMHQWTMLPMRGFQEQCTCRAWVDDRFRYGTAKMLAACLCLVHHQVNVMVGGDFETSAWIGWLRDQTPVRQCST